MSRKTDPVAVGEVIDRVRPKGRFDDPATSRVFGLWAQIVPRRVAENARPVALRRNVLVVHTSTSAWASVLSLEGEQIFAALRARLPDVPVKKLLFRAGPLPPMPLPVEEPPRSVPPPATKLPEAVARALARIGDDDLRAAVGRAAAMGIARSERDRR